MRDGAPTGTVRVLRQINPLTGEAVERAFAPGLTLAEIVEQTGIAPAYARDVVVSVWSGVSSHIVPEPLRAAVRPKAGTNVEIAPAIQGRQELALVAAISIAIAAPYAGAAAFGAAGAFGTSAIGASLVTAGVTVAGSLAINQLLAPPQPRLSRGGGQSPPSYDIGGSGNEVRPYQRVPMVIGRHRMYPPKSARPYTSVSGRDVFLYERMTFGYGPVLLEDLRIGETPITQFADVRIELRNVNKAETLARYPDLDGIVSGWLHGSQTMGLFSSDVAEDRYSVALPFDAPAVRSTRLDTQFADVEISFPRGLLYTASNGNQLPHNIGFWIEYRQAGASVWQTSEQFVATGASTSPIRFVRRVNFPAPGQYEIRVTNITDSADLPSPEFYLEDAALTAIRSVQSGTLPSDPRIAEIAVEARASDQLNGAIGELNAVVQRMVPVWTGSGWTEPQATKHPAWQGADLLRGPMRREQVPDSKIDLDALKAWADQEPNRACDYVVNSDMSVGELRGIVAAAGRAKAIFRDGKYSVIRDQAQGPVRQLFTPRNSWGFSAERLLPKDIHGFRVQVMSEAAGWQMDELIVYADGHDASTASTFEDMELPGVIMPKVAPDGGEAWRLARYHLAQHFLRSETFRFSVDLEHLVTGIGDKVRLVHDMPSIGIGQGRITALTTSGGNIATITLDDAFDIDAGSALRLTIRRRGGELVEATATGGELAPLLTITSTTSAEGVAVGDLVGVTALVQEFYDVIIKSITALDDEQATIEAIPASPGVLDADAGVIPPYAPQVNTADRQDRPRIPTIRSVFSGSAAAIRVQGAPDQARIGVEIENRSRQQVQPWLYRLRWRELTTADWTVGAPQAVAGTIFTATVDRQRTYQVQAQAIGVDGKALGWSPTRTVFAFVDDGAPGMVPGFRANVLGSTVQLTWDRPTRNVDYYEIRHSPNAAATWGESITAASRVRGQSITLPAFNGIYHIRAVNLEGTVGATSATAVIDSGILLGTVGTTLEFHPDWTGTADGGASVVSTSLQFTGGGGTTLDNWPTLDSVTAIGLFGVTAPQGTYQLTDEVDLGSVQTRRVTADVRAAGSYAGYELDKWGTLDTVTSLTGGAENRWRLVVEISTTQDTGGSPTWGDWQPLLAGDYRFAQARFRVRCEQDDINLTVTVSQLTVQVGTAA